jgi:PhzF family phenazine biosynthesis protein
MPTRTITVFQIDVFTQQLFAGNPAGVVLGAEALTEAEMQSLARELNNSDSAFVLPPNGTDHDVHLRFFTPTREVSFVGHATVAAHVARLAAGAGKPGRIRQKSRSGIYEVDIAGTAAVPTVTVAIPVPNFNPPIDAATRSKLLDILGLDTAALDPKCPLVVTKRTSTRLMIGLRTAEQLATMQPDLDELKRLTPHIGADGYFVFVRDAHGPGTTESRLFSPVLGIPEDPVSGNAHGMLGAYLVANRLLPIKDGRARFHGYQGRAMSRPGEVAVEVLTEGGAPTRILMSGTARVVFTTQVTLD